MHYWISSSQWSKEPDSNTISHDRRKRLYTLSKITPLALIKGRTHESEPRSKGLLTHVLDSASDLGGWTTCNHKWAEGSLAPEVHPVRNAFLPTKATTKIWYLGGAESLSRVRLFVIPYTVGYQVPLSMRFPRQEYWSQDAVSYNRESFWLRDQTHVYYTGRWILYHWATREATVVATHVIKHTCYKTHTYIVPISVS